MFAEAKSRNEMLPMSESSAMVLSVGMESVESRSIQEAWKCTDPEQCIKLRMAIREEFADMNKQQDWCKIKQDEIPKG